MCASPLAGFELPPRLTLNEELARSEKQRYGGGRKECRKGEPWSETEHAAFLAGLRQLGKGQWKHISLLYVPSRTPTQVASHAQKHFLRATGATKRRSRFTAVEAAVTHQQALGARSPPGDATAGHATALSPPTGAEAARCSPAAQPSGDASVPLGALHPTALLPQPGAVAEGKPFFPLGPHGIPILPTTPGRIKVTFTYDPPEPAPRAPGAAPAKRLAGTRFAAVKCEAGGAPGPHSPPAPPRDLTREAQLAALSALSAQLAASGVATAARSTRPRRDPRPALRTSPPPPRAASSGSAPPAPAEPSPEQGRRGGRGAQRRAVPRRPPRQRSQGSASGCATDTGSLAALAGVAAALSQDSDSFSGVWP
ncbi:hypothetical protein ACKKBF_B13350 [Auxenochlorella protothecoides x Auxenochlorella symbiontica]